MPGLGNITTEHTVWCGTCEEWVEICEHTMKRTIESARRDGWKKVKGLWTCPKCVAAAKNLAEKAIAEALEMYYGI